MDLKWSKINQWDSEIEVESTEENDGRKMVYDIESLELSVNKPFTK